MIKSKTDYLFEASWEVCNKVGGIYTVVKSKAYIMKEFYKNYFLIGPYFPKKTMIELNQKEPPEQLKKAFWDVKKQGISCYYGTWDVDGSPNTILIDFNSLIAEKDNIKKELWETHKIDSYNSNWEFEEPMVWSWAVGMLLCAIESRLPDKKIVGHFHEWLSGFSIFYLKKCGSAVKTVFTTHATMLGRTIAGSGEDLYNMFETINPEESAYHYKVQDKFLTERASAQEADIFTTVSETTAIEAEKLLGRKPEVILNNGLTMRKFPTIEETSMKHLLTREKIREFLTTHFFPYYNIQLEHNLIFFIVGRYEFKNKGVDVMIKALGKLNTKLKKEKSKRTISAFFWIPMETHGAKVEVLENKNYYRHIKNYVQWHSQDILKKIVMDIVSSKTPSVRSMFTKTFLKDLEKDLIQFKRHGNPLVLTHNIPDEQNDPMLRGLREAGLENREEDHVKAIIYPVYLDGNDSLINLPYYDAIAGSHLGLFPSYYEPWGYTPLETAAMGVASLTTDLAGFGRFIETKISNPKDKIRGIYVLKRFNRTKEQVVNDMYKMMYDFASLSHEDRVKNKVVAKTLANHADWRNFVENYIKAHNKAFDK
ncbi:glycogen/starch synthase [Candidatus Woesearchaeota archaeon]|nr:glycogen/starch synthase [Candidatus Woesearchaeota archaeon]